MREGGRDMTATSEEIYEAVQQAVVDALGVDEDEVTPDATLLGDLGAESIDLLDILFRLERKLGVKIQASDLAAYVQGGIPDDEFGDENEIITPRGLEQLKKAMPQINTDELAGKLKADQVMSLFTVQNLADMVSQRVGEQAG
jgi:acyl carrier protein